MVEQIYICNGTFVEYASLDVLQSVQKSNQCTGTGMHIMYKNASLARALHAS